jgi:LPS sulfotransferase NodH
MDSDFIVLTTNRSGSTWVMSTLNSLPNVTAQGELFLPRNRSSEKRWDSEFSIPRYIEAQSNGFALRPFSVFSYLDELYSTLGHVGFKLMYKQLGLYPELLIYLIRHKIRVIHLVRKNHLDVLLSYAVKANLGQAHLLEGQAAPDNMQITLDVDNLENQMRRLEIKQDLARKMLAWSKLANIEIVYEQLLRDPSQFQRIWDFLDIKPGDEMPRSPLIKIRKGSHREVIRNYEEVKEVLESSRFASLLE